MKHGSRTLKTKDGIPVGKWLECGCCGSGFEVWAEYEDQDQDADYGICKSCQGVIDDHNEREWDKGIKALRDGLNGKNREKFDAMDRDSQKAVVWKALDDGVLSFQIRRG